MDQRNTTNEGADTMANNIRIIVRIQGECNQQALFDVLAGQNRNVAAACGFDRGGWTQIAFDAKAGEKDWGAFLQSLFPNMRMSFKTETL